MTPTRGTPILRLSFRGVGLIERHTGFRDLTMTRRLKEMCRVLWDAGREDVLRDLRDQRVTFREVWAVYRTGEWRKIPTAQHGRDLVAHFTTWYEQKPHAHYRSNARAALKKLVAGRSLVLGGLREALLRYRGEAEHRREGAMFNRVQATVQAFLRDTVTTDHALYHEVGTIPSLPEPPKRALHPQPPNAARAIRELLGGELGRWWWEMCVTGMMPDEYFAHKWRLEDGRYHILGTKRETRPRFVPPLDVVSGGPALGRVDIRNRVSAVGRKLRKAGVGVTLYDARRSFGLWCDLAGLPEAWKRALLGHGPQNVTQGYGWQESERIIDEAERRLRVVLEHDTIGDTQGGQEGGSADAPGGSRTPSLLIRSQTEPTRPRKLERHEPEDNG